MLLNGKEEIFGEIINLGFEENAKHEKKKIKKKNILD